MNQKVFKTLEFFKIREQLTEYAHTPAGKQLCTLMAPMTDLSDVQKAQRETSDALSRVNKSGPLALGNLRDIRESLKRLAIGGTLGIRELLDLSRVMTACAKAKAYARNRSDEEAPDSLCELFDLLEPLTQLNREIDRCIISEEEVSDDASPELRRIRNEIKRTESKVHSQLSSILNGSRSYLQDAVITMRDGRYCLPVKAEYKAQVSGMVHDQSSTGSTLFIEPLAVIKLNNELRELEAAEKKAIEAVLAALSAQAAVEIPLLESDYELLGTLDFIFARASLSLKMKASEPIFNTRGYIHIKDARHPLLDPQKVVPITVTLGDSFDLLIVTGPNTGGKTVSLKTVGLFTLMGQCGLHIPAFDGSELAVFDDVFADIGDEQSIEQSLSTFSAHMTNIISILEKADSHSLVLFDELCAGTDPTEGAALAISILTFLHNMKVRTMATTHYSELKVFALSTEGVENACCEFNVETLSPTYHLLIGIPGKSNAFAISQKLGLPSFLIEDAGKRIGSQDAAFEDLLTDLENSRVELELEKAELERYKKETAQLREQLSTKRDRLDERTEKILARANEEARRILEDAKEQADASIRRINKLGTRSGSAKELENERRKLREKLDQNDKKLAAKQKKPAKEHKAEDFHIGDGVRVISLNTNGTVSSLPNARGELYVQMGILRSQVNIKDLELLQEDTIMTPVGVVSKTPARKKSSAGGIGMSKSFSISPEINLIGKTTDEALPELDKYIDDAYLAHLPQVRVIHGRGTGALKKAVHNYLRKCSHIDEYRLGEYGEGGIGVTVVTFKKDK